MSHALERRNKDWAQLRLLTKALACGLFRVAVLGLSDFTWQLRALREFVSRDPDGSFKPA